MEVPTGHAPDMVAEVSVFEAAGECPNLGEAMFSWHGMHQLLPWVRPLEGNFHSKGYVKGVQFLRGNE
jgi:hypothetical protein